MVEEWQLRSVQSKLAERDSSAAVTCRSRRSPRGTSGRVRAGARLGRNQGRRARSPDRRGVERDGWPGSHGFAPVDDSLASAPIGDGTPIRRTPVDAGTWPSPSVEKWEGSTEGQAIGRAGRRNRPPSNATRSGGPTVSRPVKSVRRRWSAPITVDVTGDKSVLDDSQRVRNARVHRPIPFTLHHSANSPWRTPPLSPLSCGALLYGLRSHVVRVRVPRTDPHHSRRVSAVWVGGVFLRRW